MDMIIIAYWTQTGNTKAMAEAVGEGVEIAGKRRTCVIFRRCPWTA